MKNLENEAREMPYGKWGIIHKDQWEMQPKDYGEYLMRTGKSKYNSRKRKQMAKQN